MIPNAVGAYWFVDDEIARNLIAARARVREIADLGFTEIWLAVRGLNELEGASSPMLAPSYGRFLEVVCEEAEHRGIGVIPFNIPCCLWGLEAAKASIIAGAETPAAASMTFDFGDDLTSWTEVCRVDGAWGYRVNESGHVITSSVRALDVSEMTVNSTDGHLTANLEADTKDAEFVFAAVIRDDGPIDTCSPAFVERLSEVTAFHERICGRFSSYIGLAFDEPNIGDPCGWTSSSKVNRLRRYYMSDSIHEATSDVQSWAMYRGTDVDGYEVRVRYYDTIQRRLQDALAEAMTHTRVDMMGTHDWSGDRDRAIYGTFDQLAFSATRQWGATDISGVQSDADYACAEPLLAWAQKLSWDKPRAMVMSDYFREHVDEAWLRYTNERIIALGSDYVLLHAFGPITGETPLWTSIESWEAYRQPEALENLTARLRHLSESANWRGESNVLVVFPRSTRAMIPQDRFVTREWAKTVYALHRCHHSPLTISSEHLLGVTFNGDTASFRDRDFRVIVLPWLAAIDADQLESIRDFWRAGGHVIASAPGWLPSDETGRPSERVEGLMRELFGIGGEIGSFVGPIVTAGGQYTVNKLPPGHSTYDDAVLDFGGSAIASSMSEAGGRAVLCGFGFTSLSWGAEYHRILSTGTFDLLSELINDVCAPCFEAVRHDGSVDTSTFGLVRTTGSEVIFTGTRLHAEPVRLNVGAATIHGPAGTAAERAPGVNVFVRNCQEAVHVVTNPMREILRQVDLGFEIASARTADGADWIAFDGSHLHCAIAPGSEMRFAQITSGPRDPNLPVVIGSVGADVLEASTRSGRSILRLTGGPDITLKLSFNPVLGTRITARCPTSGQPATVEVESNSGRINVTIKTTTFPTIENDVEVVQSSD